MKTGNPPTTAEIFSFLFDAPAPDFSGVIEVQEVVLDDLDFALLGRALTYRRTAAELRIEAAKVTAAAARMDLQSVQVLAELQASLRAKGLGR
jgi:hypothetical protein